ncbi:MAG: hypothetical protein PUB52_04910 [Lachnospiraceae bacterium]|nr:hypothetical protein [Lachnospiraceae bacterium]
MKNQEFSLFLIRRKTATPREMLAIEETSAERLSVLSKNGFVVPIMANQRIRYYELSEFTKNHEKEIIKCLLQ